MVRPLLNGSYTYWGHSLTTVHEVLTIKDLLMKCHKWLKQILTHFKNCAAPFPAHSWSARCKRTPLRPPSGPRWAWPPGWAWPGPSPPCKERNKWFSLRNQPMKMLNTEANRYPNPGGMDKYKSKLRTGISQKFFTKTEPFFHEPAETLPFMSRNYFQF
jgi:hypothetical protein